MHRLIWLSAFLILTTSFGQISAASQIGVCSAEAKQQSPVQQNENKFYGISDDKSPSQEKAQVVIINRNKPKNEEDTKKTETESPKTVSNPRRSPTRPISFKAGEIPNNPDHASYYDEQESPYEVPYTPSCTYEEYQPKSKFTKKLILPAVVAGGLAGIGVRTAMMREECENKLKLKAVEDLTFDFRLDFTPSEQGAFIDFNVVLPDGSIFATFTLNMPGETATAGPIPNVYPGQTITIVATNYQGSLTTTTFTMTGLIKGVAFDTQTFDFISTTPPPPQSFTFMIPFD